MVPILIYLEAHSLKRNKFFLPYLDLYWEKARTHSFYFNFIYITGYYPLDGTYNFDKKGIFPAKIIQYLIFIRLGMTQGQFIQTNCCV